MPTNQLDVERMKTVDEWWKSRSESCKGAILAGMIIAVAIGCFMIAWLLVYKTAVGLFVIIALAFVLLLYGVLGEPVKEIDSVDKRHG